MTRRRLYAIAFVAVPLIYFLSLPIRVDDLAPWAALGLRFFETGAIPRQDTFSVLPTTEMIYPVGTSVLYALLYRAGGLLAVSIIHKLCLAALLILVYRLSLGRLRRPWSTENLALVVAFYAGTRILYLDRPALLVFPLLVLAAAALDRPGPLSWRAWASLWALNVAWNNLHGSAALLPVLAGWRLALSALERVLLSKRRTGVSTWPWRDLAGTALLSASALLTPFGTSILGYYASTRRISQARFLGEWASPFALEFLPQGLLLCGLAAAALVALVTRKSLARRLDLLRSPFFPLLLLGFDSVRNTALPFLVLLPLAAAHGLLFEGRPPTKDRRAPNLLAATAILATLAAFTPFLKPLLGGLLPAGKREVFDSSVPFHAAEWLRAAPRGTVYNSAFGGFLMLEQPNRIFFDARNTIYTDQAFADYARIYFAAPGWQDLLDRHQTRYLVLDRAAKSLKLLHAVEASKAWRRELVDGDAVVFSRFAPCSGAHDRGDPLVQVRERVGLEQSVLDERPDLRDQLLVEVRTGDDDRSQVIDVHGRGSQIARDHIARAAFELDIKHDAVLVSLHLAESSARDWVARREKSKAKGLSCRALARC